MNNKIEIKYVYFDEDLNIIDANREFYVYFENPGINIASIDDIVCPSSKKTLVRFLKSKNKEREFKLIQFKRHMTEPKYNIVMAYDSFFNGMNTTCLKIIDIEDTLDFVKDYHFEDLELAYALSITDDCIFSYQPSTNIFKIMQFFKTKRTTLYKQDIDEWQKTSIEGGLVPDRQQGAFLKFVDTLKSCPKEISADIESSFRTLNPNITESLSFSGVRFVDNTEISMVGRIMPKKDMRQAQTAKSIIEELQIDPLTKVHNKKTITSFAKKLFSENRNENIALCIVDLDHFKPVNDAYGHMAGDKVLEETGRILQEIAGEQGTVGRYGGDEFIILERNIDTELSLRGFLHSIMLRIRDAFAGKFDNINITCSIGCAVYPRNGTDYDELFKKADFGLYRAKDKGRNRYVFFRDDLHAELYKKAIAASTGIKYDDREVKELKFMSDFMQDLTTAPNKAIKQILEHMIETYNLDDVAIYYGEDLNLIYSCGKKAAKTDSVPYVHTEAFKLMLNGQHFFRVDFLENIPAQSLSFKEELVSRGIKSTVQCILGSENDIKGLVAFNRRKEASLWAEYEVNCEAMFAACLNLLPESTKVDFALYSKLKNQ